MSVTLGKDYGNCDSCKIEMNVAVIRASFRKRNDKQLIYLCPDCFISLVKAFIKQFGESIYYRIIPGGKEVKKL